MRTVLTSMAAILAAGGVVVAGGDTLADKFEGKLDSFLGDAKFEMQQIFKDQRLSNVVVAMDGTVLAAWGWGGVRVRRSEDGGKTWEPEIAIGKGLLSGGVTVDEKSGDILLFTEDKLEKEADLRYERAFAWSIDGGATWRNAGYHKNLPDGPAYRGMKRRGSNYNGHFGMMGGLTRLPVATRDILIYSNADTPDHNRVKMTVWASFDGGKTWPVKRLVSAGPGAYSSLDAGRPGTKSDGWIYLLYEGGGGKMAHFNMGWLLQGEKTGDGEVPKWVSREGKE